MHLLLFQLKNKEELVAYMLVHNVSKPTSHEF